MENGRSILLSLDIGSYLVDIPGVFRPVPPLPPKTIRSRILALYALLALQTLSPLISFAEEYLGCFYAASVVRGERGFRERYGKIRIGKLART